MWRKTRSTGVSSVCRGADANRNFDFQWAGITSQFTRKMNCFVSIAVIIEPGSSPDPCSETYHGPTASSESVIRHYQNYIYEKRNEIDSHLSFHSYGQLILYAWGYTAEPPPNKDELVSPKFV